MEKPQTDPWQWGSEQLYVMEGQGDLWGRYYLVRFDWSYT